MEIAALILFPAIVLFIGCFGGIITSKNINTWYKKLIHPPLTPPSWLFGPAWTILYIMVGLSGYFIYSQKGGFRTVDSTAWLIYFVQLFLNYIWTPIFFGWKKLSIASIDIALLDIFVIANIIKFFQITPIAGLILIPYLIWISFATYLSFAFWYLNGDEREKDILKEEK